MSAHKGPIIAGTLRRFRLMIGAEFMPRRCYAMSLNAHKAANWEIYFIKVGQTIEVVDVEFGRVLGQYTKTPTGVRVWWHPREQMSWKTLRKMR